MEAATRMVQSEEDWDQAESPRVQALPSIPKRYPSIQVKYIKREARTLGLPNAYPCVVGE